MTTRSLALPQGAFGLLLLLALTLFSCKKDNKTIQKPKNNPFISAYSAGVIGRESSIKVQFADQAIAPEKVGTSADNVVKTNPVIKGKAVWENEYTIAIKPDEILPVNTVYEMKVDVSKVFEKAKGEDANFEFGVRTKPQYLQFDFDQLQTEDTKTYASQKLTASLSTNDVAEKEKIEKSLTVSVNGTTMPVTWEHNDDGLNHKIILPKVPRTNDPEKIKFEWDGKNIDSESKGSWELEVPSLKKFGLIHQKLSSDKEYAILLNFSDPLDASQELEGLVTISDNYGKLRFAIEGNIIKVYPDQQINGTKTVTINKAIKNNHGVTLPENIEVKIDFSESNPQVKILGKGVILPSDGNLILPIKVVNLTAVDVEIFKIYQNNVLQFLQINDLNGDYELNRVGEIVYQDKIDLLAIKPNANTRQWTKYGLDLTKFVSKDPDAIYSVRLGFRPDYVSNKCEDMPPPPHEIPAVGEKNDQGQYTSFYDENWDGLWGYYSGYNWQKRQDPCGYEYYCRENFTARNIIPSNIGIIAKRSTTNELFVACTRLSSAESLSGANIEIYSYQMQKIAEGTTDNQGMVKIKVMGEPAFIVARNGKEKGYLKITSGQDFNLSQYEIEGTESIKGLKGYIYGERGVWRPGDSIYLQFVLQDIQKSYEKHHPVRVELRDPLGALVLQKTVSDDVDGVYPIHIATRDDANTGSYSLKVSIGNAEFRKSVPIETVKPNRLKVNLSFGAEKLKAADLSKPGSLSSNWLTGLPAANLRALVEVSYKANNTQFANYKEFSFNDDTKQYPTTSSVLFDQKLDEKGTAQVPLKIENLENAPGELTAIFKTRVFEPGGDASADQSSVKISPFNAYTGIKIPKPAGDENRLDLNKEGVIETAVVDADGRPVAGRVVTVNIYTIEWRWWWYENNESTYKYNGTQFEHSMFTLTGTTDARGIARVKVTIPAWGCYVARVANDMSQHTASDIFYVGYPWYDGEDTKNSPEASMLHFKTDKTSYQIGENISISIPATEKCRALVTLENGTGIYKALWFDLDKEKNRIEFKAESGMAPNVYAYVTLIQPQAGRNNDLPIRMYGVVPVLVNDPATKIKPEIKMPEVLKPEEQASIEVSEAKGTPMTYTIDIVDEGLLDLTKFKTPDPWNYFFAKEALSVKSWDLFDFVLGSYGAEIPNIVSIGGDGVDIKAPSAAKANRFKPVVLHFGPYKLAKGEHRKHNFTMSSYVGSVRAMVVASNTDIKAYGSAEKTVPVKKAVMTLATLPRTLTVGDQLTIPVSVFAMENKVKDVTVSIQDKSGLIRFTGATTSNVSFTGLGEKTISFPASVAATPGIGKVTVIAKGGGETATQNIEIDVRNPNPYVTLSDEQDIAAKAAALVTVNRPGVKGTNTGYLEVSNMPSVNLGTRINYLIGYPHGCLEQTVSKAFPQLYLKYFAQLTPAQKQGIEYFIKEAVQKVNRFWVPGGGYSIWPGERYADHWVTSYAGHFLIEAQKQGYTVPGEIMTQWKQFQKTTARLWKPQLDRYGFYEYHGDLVQAYRLYTLAAAGAPEIGAMNQLKANNIKDPETIWMLASAYAMAGKVEVAKNMTQSLTTEIKPYTEMSWTYGSDLRGYAVVLESLMLQKDGNRQAQLAKIISKKLGSEDWYSTQSTGYAMMVMGRYYMMNKPADGLKFQYTLDNGKPVDVSATEPLFYIEIPVDKANVQKIKIQNLNSGQIFARIVTKGQPAVGNSTPITQGIKFDVTYTDKNGNSLDISRIKQGTDFTATVVVHNATNPWVSLQQLALTQIVPSGWEIINDRIFDPDKLASGARIQYQDIRDDRMISYFNVSGDVPVIKLKLNAAYTGKFYMPDIQVSAMYDDRYAARGGGRWVEVY